MYPQTYRVNDGLQNVLRLADAALSAAGRAKKGTTPEATDFLRVQEEIKRFSSPSPRQGAPPGPRRNLIDPETALEHASKKDEKSMSAYQKSSRYSRPPGHTKKVNFVILEKPHEEPEDQLIINQEIDNSTTAAEIIWRFSLYPEKTEKSARAERITPKIASRQNPHFYLQLSKDATTFDSRFRKNPLRDFAHGLRQGDNHLHIVGVLESEDNVFRNIGGKQDYWHRPLSPIRFSAMSNLATRVMTVKSSAKPVVNGRDVVEVALRSQNVDLMIRDQSMPKPPADSGWKPLPSPEPIVKVQAPDEDQTTLGSPPFTCLI
ncbi:hypothetical protein BJY52DRAFT_1215868 [Lactarius psammicola]|nr:hypothetical protein BJY52DRAFT_1215868 [Lactarius psammicola]